LCKGQRFVVQGTYGPLRDGELEKARQWGAELAQEVAAGLAPMARAGAA
jgi:hypothetical protein